MLKLKIIFALSLIGLIFPGFSFALIDPEFTQKIYEIYQRIFSVLLTIAIPLAVIFILWAAFILITSAGQPEKVQKGKRIITYCLIGLFVIFLSEGIVVLVGKIAGVKVEEWYQRQKGLEYISAEEPNQFYGEDLISSVGEELPPPPG